MIFQDVENDKIYNREYIYLDLDHELDDLCESAFKLINDMPSIEFLHKCGITWDIRWPDAHRGISVRRYYKFEWNGFKIVLFRTFSHTYDRWWKMLLGAHGKDSVSYDCNISLNGYDLEDYKEKLAVAKKAFHEIMEKLNDLVNETRNKIKDIAEEK